MSILKLAAAAMLSTVKGLQIGNTTNLVRVVDDDQVVVAFGKSDSDDMCVTAEAPVTCDKDAGNYGKRVNSELQPNKDPAPDQFEITVDENDPKKVCVKRTDNHDNAGWGQDLQVACTRNVCTCEGGTELTDDCTTNGANMCSDCDQGFTLNNDDKSCKANVCTCDDGTPKDGADCTADAANLCKECNPGFRADGDSCKANVCKCDDGTAKDGADCTTDAANLCKDCNPGFRADGDSCKANVCKCDNGSPKSGADCTQDNANICDSCNGGYHPDGNNCAQDPQI